MDEQTVREVRTIRAWEDLNRRRGRQEREGQFVFAGWSAHAIRHRPDIIDAYCEDQDPYHHGIKPPYSNRKSRKRRSPARQLHRPAQPYRWTDEDSAGVFGVRPHHPAGSAAVDHPAQAG